MQTRTTMMASRHLRDLFSNGTVTGQTDGQLLARYATCNDGSAFAALVTRHGPMVVATCRAVLKGEHDIEDAFQATFFVLARKAASVRTEKALGGWLHRVAYRIAVQAKNESERRRRYESEAAAMTTSRTTRPGPDVELCSILHAEIERLPERERLPVVLVDLEGLSYEQAAGRLQWTVPALCYRLARARARLRERLVRRGVTATAVGVMLATSVTTATAAPPASWVREAVALATGAPVPAAVAALTKTIVTGMFMTQLKITVGAVVATAGIVYFGVVALGATRDEGPMPAQSPTVVAKEQPAAAKAPLVVQKMARPKAAPGSMIEFRGRVIDPGGKAVAGASVQTAFIGINSHIKPVPQSNSGPDGRFSLRVPSPLRTFNSLAFRDGTPPLMVATAPGFGPGCWNAMFCKPGKDGELTIRLAEDGPPIEGRIVDLEGRPVAGANVKVERLWYAGEGTLSDWLTQAADRGVPSPWEGLTPIPITTGISIATTTGPDGRFCLAATGRNRIAEILVSAPTIATAHLYVVNYDGPAITIVKAGSMRPKSAERTVFHARRFDYAAAPTRAIEGTIRDKDTGRPLAGIKLHGMVFEEHSQIWAPGVEAVTDTQGRYRLTGLASGPAYRLFAGPGEGMPYPGAVLRAPADSPGLGPVKFDIVLKRGVIVRGRVTDKATGKPVPGCVESYTFGDNPHVREFPGYSDGQAPITYVQDDGRFEIVTLPGRGIIACQSDSGRYKVGVGAEAIKGRDDFGFDTEPSLCPITLYHALAEVNIDDRAESATVDLQVDPGRTLVVTAVDPEGKPIGGTTVRGLTDGGGREIDEESPSFEVRSLDPSNPRNVVVKHEGRKLVGLVQLKGDEPDPITVRLEPWGTITGRIVDDDGNPRGGLKVASVPIGRDGRFRFEGMVPGHKYEASAAQGYRGIGTVYRDVTVEPGEVKDLGDLKVVPPRTR